MEKNKITSSDIKKMKLLTEDELDKLNFHELCLYFSLLDEMEKELKEEE